MKLKNTNKIALRALAITATLAAAHAAIVPVTTTPYVYPNAGTNADTIQANAGGALITVNAGSILTGNLPISNPALIINAAGYVVNNSGTLTGNGTAAGSTVAFQTTINNLAGGRISSVSAPGISITAGINSILTNSGIIEGGDDGIRTAINGQLTIVNSVGGEIRGITGANSDGIQALDTLDLTNSGVIFGNAYGVNAGGNAKVTNSTAGSTITGTTRGVSAGAGLLVVNSGTITATAAAGNGIFATTGATINNHATGMIQGATDGVQVTTGTIGITNAGTIRSTAAVGTANCDGVQLTDGPVINTGTIIGAADGIRYAGLGNVTNSGAISGTVGVEFAATNDVLTMTGGTISILGTGTNAVTFGAGDDTLNLNGGLITGNVDGGAGTNDRGLFDVADSATIAGNVVGFETILKTSAGAAAVNGNTAAETITVSAGSLYLNGNVAAPTGSIRTETTINLNGGELGGTGVWDASVNQAAGMLSAGAAPFTTGNVTIGDVGAAPYKLNVTGGDLLVHMNARTLASDLVTVNGSAFITAGVSNLLVSPINRDAPLQSARVLDVTGTGNTRTGQYAAAKIYFEPGSTDSGPLVANGVFLGDYTTSSTVFLGVANSLLDANDTDVVVVHRYDNPALALTPFGQQFGAALNTMVANSTSDPILADFLGYLDYSDAATVANVLNAYEPRDFQASLAYSVASSREIHRIVEQQNAGDRMFPGGTHVWGNYNYSDYSSAGTSNRFTVGAGGAIDTFHFGALVSYADANVSDATDIESLSYGVYFAMGGSTGWQWNGYVGGSHADTTTNLTPAVSALSPVYNAVNFEPNGDGFQALLSGGYMMEQGGCTWGPTFGVEYIAADLDGGFIPGANLPGMSVSADKLNSLRSLLGVRAEFAAGDKIRPYVSAQWAHEFDGESNGYTATIQGGSFAVNSPLELSKDTIILRAGVVVGIGDSWFGDVGYLGELSTDSEGNDYNGLNLGLHAAF